MKRYGSLFERIVDIENIIQAHLNARKGKMKDKSVRIVDENILEYCEKIREMLLNKTFTTSKYHIFEIEDNNKKREIAELPYYPDRIIQWAILQIIEPIFCKHFIPTTYAAIPNKGTHAALTKMRNDIKNDIAGTQYCLKLDIKKFFLNIDKTILKSLLRRKFKDKDLLWLLDDIVDSYNKESINGIPIGSYTSQYFGNFYLSYFDHYMKERKRIKYYYRYMDDIVILSDSKEYLHNLRKEIFEYMSKNLNLTIKENWQIFPIAIRGIDFVGYRCFGKYTLLRTRTKRRLHKVMKRLQQKMNRGRKFSHSNQCTIGSYYGILKWGDCTRLRNNTINKFLEVKNGEGKRKSRRKTA